MTPSGIKPATFRVKRVLNRIMQDACRLVINISQAHLAKIVD